MKSCFDSNNFGMSLLWRPLLLGIFQLPFIYLSSFLQFLCLVAATGCAKSRYKNFTATKNMLEICRAKQLRICCAYIYETYRSDC